MSSVKACEKHAHRKPKVSYATLIDVGLVGPKPRPKGVGDGQLVNIPAPPVLVKPGGGHRKVSRACLLDMVRLQSWKGLGKVEGQPKTIRLNLCCQEKPAGLGVSVRTVNRHW
jgi:hypothetical protein